MYKDFDLSIYNSTKILNAKYKVVTLPCLIICDMIVLVCPHKLIEIKGLNKFPTNYEHPKRFTFG